MFSQSEKRQIAEIVERALLALDHPEMPKERPSFTLHVNGKESWSWADIAPNWTFDDKRPGVNPWNEMARGVMGSKVGSVATRKIAK